MARPRRVNSFRGSEQRWSLRLRVARVTVLIMMAGAIMVTAGTPENLGEALRAQRALVAQNPYDVAVLNDFGNLLALAGRLEESEEVYRRALAIEPQDVTSLYNLALVLQEQGRSKEALKTFQTIVQIDPNHAWAHYQLGSLHQAAGHRPKALAHYERAFSLDRSLTSPKVNPHIVENNLLTEALLQSYLHQSPSTQAPRLYRQPGSVADLLLPPEKSPPEEPGDSAASPITGGAVPRHRASFQADEVEEPDLPADRESDRQPQTIDESSIGSPTVSGARPSRRPTSTGAEQKQPIETAPSDPETAPDVMTTPPRSDQDLTPSGSSIFVPGLQSTGRLDIELLPARDFRSAAAAS